MFVWFKNIIGTFFRFSYKRENSPSQNNKAKHVGRDQVGKQEIVQNNFFFGSNTETNELIESIIQKQTPAPNIFRPEDQEEKKKRMIEYYATLAAQAEKQRINNQPPLKDNVDTRSAILEGMELSAKQKEPELRKLLAKLVIERIKNEDPEKNTIKDCAFKGAISKINELTPDQLKIITLCFLLRYISISPIEHWGTFNIAFLTRFFPFLSFKNTNSEFSHLEYLNLTTRVDISEWNFFEGLRQNYSFLFLNSFDKNLIDKYELPFINDLVSEQGEKYLFKHKTSKLFEEYLSKASIDLKISKELLNIYNMQIKNIDQVKEDVCNKTNWGKEILAIWNSSPFKHLSLTTAGFAIAITHYEQVTGEKLDVSIWIN